MSANQLYNEKELLERIAGGDEDAFAEVYQYYYSRLRAYLWRFTGSPDDTAEILQAAFIRVWLSRDKLLTVHNFRAWVYKVCSREAMGFLRRQLTERKRLEELPAYEIEAAEGTTPLDNLHVSQVQSLIREAIEQMPEQRKLIFQMYRLEGLKVGEIAKRLNLSVSTIKNTVSTAQKHIREHLSAAGYYIPAVLFLISL